MENLENVIVTEEVMETAVEAVTGDSQNLTGGFLIGMGTAALCYGAYKGYKFIKSKMDQKKAEAKTEEVTPDVCDEDGNVIKEGDK